MTGAPTGMPTDADLIALLRRRVGVLETAVLAYLEAMREMAEPVRAAWERYDGALDRNDRNWRDAAREFIGAYRASLPKRRAIVEALVAAVTTDFETAVLTAPDMTDAQRAHWVALCAAAAETQEQER